MSCAYHSFFVMMEYLHNNCRCCKKKKLSLVFPVHAMKAYRGSGGLAPFIFILCARWK